MVNGLLPEPGVFAAFLGASFLLAATPGADMMLVLNRSLMFDRRAGLIALLGLVIGGVCHVLAAAFGLALLVSQFPILFAAIRIVGVLFLLYLAAKIFMSHLNSKRPLAKDLSKDNEAVRKVPPNPHHFRDALLTNLLNPKVALFILAFVPQFIAADTPNPAASFILLGIIFLAQGWVIMGMIALLAPRVRLLMTSKPGLLRYVDLATAGIFIMFAVKLLGDLVR
ncbi:MAG: LysE family translocator [Pseudomonadota bacterium]